jgi:hypothetical protein
MPALYQQHPGPCYPSDRGVQMEVAAQAQTTLTATDPVQRWLARRSAGAAPNKKLSPPTPSLPANSAEAQRARRAPQKRPGTVPRRTPFCANTIEPRRAAINRANSAHSTGPRTESGKQRSSQNALSHGLTARTAVLPTEDPDTYQRHIQQFLDEYAPATPTETQLVHEIGNTAWRLNRIPFLEAELFSQTPNPQTLIPQLGNLTEAAELFLRHQYKGLPWEPTAFSSEDGFVFSKQQVERHARQLMRQNPTLYAAHPPFQADPPPTEAAF